MGGVQSKHKNSLDTAACDSVGKQMFDRGFELRANNKMNSTNEFADDRHAAFSRILGVGC